MHRGRGLSLRVDVAALGVFDSPPLDGEQKNVSPVNLCTVSKCFPCLVLISKEVFCAETQKRKIEQTTLMCSTAKNRGD